MAKYEDNMQGNIDLQLLRKGIKRDLDGKVRLNLVVDETTPWITAKADPERECEKWLFRYFHYFSLIPWQCTGCWKIYHNPKTLKDLFAVREFQRDEEKNLGLGRKCGLETREFTGNVNGYVAFWYNPLFVGLDKARQNVKLLREALGREDVFLKRGCTEMEIYTVQRFGVDSAEWSKLVARTSLELQKRLDEIFVRCGEVSLLSEDMQKVVENRWIDAAIATSKAKGDMTYLEFVDKNPVVSLTNYAGSIHRANDFVGGKDGEHYLVNVAGRREAEKYFGRSLGGNEGLVLPELETDELCCDGSRSRVC